MSAPLTVDSDYCPAADKRRHVTAGNAYGAIKSLCKRHKNKVAKGRMHSYRCNCCHGWHVGHAVKEIA